MYHLAVAYFFGPPCRVCRYCCAAGVAFLYMKLVCRRH